MKKSLTTAPSSGGDSLTLAPRIETPAYIKNNLIVAHIIHVLDLFVFSL